jgi:hypothetical protein
MNGDERLVAREVQASARPSHGLRDGCTLATYGDQLAGKVVVDTTNPDDLDTYAPLTIAEAPWRPA